LHTVLYITIFIVEKTVMDKIKRKLEKLTLEVLTCDDIGSDVGADLIEQLTLIKELAATHRLLENSPSADPRISIRLNALTESIFQPRGSGESFNSSSYTIELKTIQALIKAWATSDGIELKSDERELERKSSKRWDCEGSALTTKIKLTKKQEEALYLIESGQFNRFLAVGGSGSGKSFVLVYYVIRETLRHKAPCLIARDKMIDLTQGVIDQIVPAILQKIAEANKQERWDKWVIDGLKFAKLVDKKSKLEFATGGYIRYAGLSARDLSESGSDKILSPSWLHVLLEEISELDFEIIEKIITRLRHKAENVVNMLLLCENPPSINHWSYKRFFEGKREDGSMLDDDEREAMYAILMNPQDNEENLGETYIRSLSQLTGANRERFYLGQFQDTETGEVFKRIQWVDKLPRDFDWDKLVIYTDPTPLTGKDYSKWADYKASVLCGLYGAMTYVIDVRIVRGSTMDMLQNIKQLWDMSPDKSRTDVVMEKKQVPSDFKQVLTLFQHATGWLCPMKFDTRVFHDKKASIETFLQPLFENDLIAFNSAFRDKERGRETQVQILKFSRKANKMIHDDIPDAIMRADTYMKGRYSKIRTKPKDLVAFIRPAFVHKN
jgi:GTPase SAR1 family protein